MIDAEYLRAILRYEPLTGRLFWRRRDDRRTCWNTRFADKEAMTADNGDGYRCGSINGKTYLAHRVIFAMKTGRWVPEIDHRNGRRSDNRWRNLREVTRSINLKNQRISPRNTSGTTGVRYRADTRKWTVWIGKKYVGQFPTRKKATAIRRKAEREHNYHRNHGRVS